MRLCTPSLPSTRDGRAWRRRISRAEPVLVLSACALLLAALLGAPLAAQRTTKPVLHARHWLAITGKPLAATAGAVTFARGGNAVDATCAMLAATSTMWDTLGWGGETQALIWNPRTREVIGVNGLGVAPSGATVEFFQERGMRYPPEYGALAATTPGTPGALMVMLAEYGRLSLAEVLGPAIEMADGYPIEQSQADNMERRRELLSQWPYSRSVFLPHLDAADPERRAAPVAGEVFRQLDLRDTLLALVEAERQALAAGKGRKEAIQAAYDLFYRGEIAEELVRATQEQGGLITLQDLDTWQVKLEPPVSTTYKGIEVYKLTTWTQGPVMLQALNILENVEDLKAMGYNSARYLHTLYQAMNLAFADRDFYYGDPAFPPAEPLEGLLSKEYARQRFQQIDWSRNDAETRPGNPYDFQQGEHPFLDELQRWTPVPPDADAEGEEGFQQAGSGAIGPDRFAMSAEEAFWAGTTSIQAADAEGWVVSVTPSGGWIPAVVAGRTGIGLSQRMQSFVLDPVLNPYNLPQPGKRPRVTLTPGMALRDGEPWLSFSVQGGDTQDQNLLQFFLNVVEFGMDVQQAVEAANLTSYQMQSSFGAHQAEPGRLVVRSDTPPWVRAELRRMGYDVEVRERTSGPITAIVFDREYGTMWGGASDFGEDYGIGW
ncbi:MAG: gamma-glutamyltransferase family protein [Acidobacteria bacterium]|nr:MAG: gamma-glutamyltransferase family protein [Acidobacteriota bacterium]